MKTRILVTGASGFIGTNLVDALASPDVDIVNVDIRPPTCGRQGKHWVACDILERRRLARIVGDFAPHYVIHLAARTDCDEATTVERGYAVNTYGTDNVLRAVEGVGSVRHLVVTSTQYVCGPGYEPRNELDFAPHTVYGASKVITEELTWSAGLQCPWTIIRPANIWGPWHARYQEQFWSVAARGLYVHPAGLPVYRTYGYVGNVVWQIGEILAAPLSLVHQAVLYVGDLPIDVFEWADAFCRALRGRGARRVPRFALRALGLAGDAITAVAGSFPLTTSRFRNMIEDYVVDMESTFALLGPPPYSLEQGVAESVGWLTADAEGRRESWRPARPVFIRGFEEERQLGIEGSSGRSVTDAEVVG